MDNTAVSQLQHSAFHSCPLVSMGRVLPVPPVFAFILHSRNGEFGGFLAIVCGSVSALCGTGSPSMVLPLSCPVHSGIGPRLTVIVILEWISSYG